MTEVYFIFNSITNDIENLVKEAKKELFLVSPFIDLSPNIKDELSLKKKDPNFFLRILFGKNEGSYLKSFKKDSLTFLMDFPNIEIKYNERLHAKFYMNDWNCILTSMNLYDYSLNKNIECGVYYPYKHKNILVKATELLNDGLETVKEKILGENEDEDPIEKMNEVYENSELLYKTEPILKEKKGVFSALSSAITKNEIEGKKIIINKFDLVVDTPEPKTEDIKSSVPKSNQKKVPSGRKVSLSKISKSMNVDAGTLKTKLENEGLVVQGKITATGQEFGLEIKSYMGNDYIAYPEDLYVFEK